MKSQIMLQIIGSALFLASCSVAAPLYGTVHDTNLSPSVQATLAGDGMHGATKDTLRQTANNGLAAANFAVQGMRHVFDNPHEPGHQAILAGAFGPNHAHHRDRINQGITALEHGSIHIDPHADLGAHNHDKTASMRTYQGGHKVVALGPKFHALGSDERRGETIIHEASHALIGTMDNHVPFTNTHGHVQLRPIPGHEVGHHPQVFKGYEHRDFQTVINHSHDPTKNADSWKKFGRDAAHALENASTPTQGHTPLPPVHGAAAAHPHAHPHGQTQAHPHSHPATGHQHAGTPGHSQTHHAGAAAHPHGHTSSSSSGQHHQHS